MASTKSQLQTIRTEGALFPPDILRLIATQKVDGVNAESYHLTPGTKLNEAITQSWTTLLSCWKAFDKTRRELFGGEETGTALTNEKWLLPFFKELDYGRLTVDKSPVIDERTYPIERFYNNTPIHLVGCQLPLDRRTKGARGAATASPYSMVQEYLNRSEKHVWGFVSNGLQLRVLRDNVSLSRQAFVEFDLEAMFEGEVYSDFALLWLLCHQSRVEAEKPEDSWLEKWSKLAKDQGTRVLQELRSGVANAISALGQGFIGHPKNDLLREKLRNGNLSKEDFYRQLLKVVYRLLFLFVAEDRELLHPVDADDNAKELYDKYYSTRRIRDMSRRIRGSKHGDLWHNLSLVFAALGKNDGCRQLGLIGLGSFLWRSESTKDILGPAQSAKSNNDQPVHITNDDLLLAIRSLAYTEQNKVLRTVDYRNLGSEELGSVYESLLELHPIMHVEAKSFSLDTAAGNERKTTGSYYTPDSLVQCLLDSALEPVVQERLREAKEVTGKSLPYVEDKPSYATENWVASIVPNSKGVAPTKTEIFEHAILSLKVCDPACGSGHFLIAAAHRLARHLARIRTGESEPGPNEYQHALRDVIGRCIYGVDINPMAVELCKVSLWMEAIEAGKPLSFLDQHILCGNSLLGTTPALLALGIPDTAFLAIEGDDKEVCAQLKKQNKREVNEFKSGQHLLFEPPIKLGNLASEYARLANLSDETLDGVQKKEAEFAKLVSSTPYLYTRFLADLWCSAFVWKKEDSDLGRFCPTERVFRQAESNPHSTNMHVRAEVERLRDHYQFFHWHLSFPEVFHLPGTAIQARNDETGWIGGFDVMLGNPPWEKVQPEEQQFFAASRTDIAEAVGNKRKALIERLAVEDPMLHHAWLAYQRKIEGWVHLIKHTGGYPLSERGKVNTYGVFLELSWRRLGPGSRVGMIVQTGLVIDDSNKDLMSAFVKGGAIVAVYDFENKALLFPAVHPEQRFALVTLQSEGSSATIADFAFWLVRIEDLTDESRHFNLSSEQLAKLSPNTGACPTFRTRREAEIVAHIYSTVEVMMNETAASPGWRAKPTQFINLTSDSHQFVREPSLHEKFVPVYEGKFTQLYDHRYATFTDDRPNSQLQEVSVYQHDDPEFSITPQFWMRQTDFDKHLREIDWDKRWFLSFHDIANPNNERTSLFCAVPCTAVGNSSPVFTGDLSPTSSCALLAACNSFAFDFVTRRRIVSRHLNFFILKQLPVPSESRFTEKCAWIDETIGRWLVPRVLELTYTAWDLEPFGLDNGYKGPPFRWDAERRFLLRAELDAAFFHLYLSPDLNGNWLAAPNENHEDLARLAQSFPTPRDAAAYILDTFPLVRRKDEEKNAGDYRTKRVILEIYDEMLAAMRTGQPYQTHLNPPPGPPIDSQGEFIPVAEWNAYNNWPSHIHRPRESAERTL